MKLKEIKFNCVKSTNDEAIKLINKGRFKECLIVARKQTGGRGTYGKKWISSDGNLFITIFFELKNKKIRMDQFLKINSLIIKKILKKFIKVKIKIKKPNDLLVKGRKICGILQEVVNKKNKKFLIIGIGVNTVNSPKSSSFRSSSIADFSDVSIKNKEILIKIKHLYEKYIPIFNKKKFNYIKTNL
mgnify:CR=1 FL=1